MKIRRRITLRTRMVTSRMRRMISEASLTATVLLRFDFFGMENSVKGKH
jgi:hypothetical protein